jgi:hypothetical protein
VGYSDLYGLLAINKFGRKTASIVSARIYEKTVVASYESLFMMQV